jgi:hypothetical protein
MDRHQPPVNHVTPTSLPRDVTAPVSAVRHAENTACSTVVCWFSAAAMCLPQRCVATSAVQHRTARRKHHFLYSCLYSFPGNGPICHNKHSAEQTERVTCHLLIAVLYSSQFGGGGRNNCCSWTVRLLRSASQDSFEAGMGRGPINAFISLDELNWTRMETYVRFEVFTAISMKKIVFWDLVPCSCC